MADTSTSLPAGDASWALVISDRSAWVTARTGRLTTVAATSGVTLVRIDGSGRTIVIASASTSATGCDTRPSPAAPVPPAI